MANFEKAFYRICNAEGFIPGKTLGYVNDPNDAGGETIAGISRKNWPKEPIWKTVDAAKKISNFPANLVKYPQLTEDIRNFYRKNFWDKISGDLMVSQSIAGELLDTAVNRGISYAIKLAQSVLDFPQTGKVTPEFVKKLNSFV